MLVSFNYPSTPSYFFGVARASELTPFRNPTQHLTESLFGLYWPEQRRFESACGRLINAAKTRHNYPVLAKAESGFFMPSFTADLTNNLRAGYKFS